MSRYIILSATEPNPDEKICVIELSKNQLSILIEVLYSYNTYSKHRRKVTKEFEIYLDHLYKEIRSTFK